MSHRAVSGEQFSEQLKMFMSPDEIIDKYHKDDAKSRVRLKSPREQWEHPLSGPNGSLRDVKLRAVDDNPAFRQSWDTAPPIDIVHGLGASSGRVEGPHLANGHHRLAHAERAGIPFMAVQHHE